MTDTKSSIVRLILNADKFEILVKPDPALDYKLGKKVDISNILVSDEIYSDANKGTRVPNEKLIKNFKTTDQIEIAKQILEHGDVNLTTDQRRRMVEEKKKQIIQYISRNLSKNTFSSSAIKNRKCDGTNSFSNRSLQETRGTSKKNY